MGNFNRDRKPNGFGGGRSGGFGGRGGGRSGGFGGRGGGRGFGGGRDGGRPQMHQATCSECGNRCEVPFRPTGDKPVYCSDCFGHSPNYGSQRAKGNKNFDRGGRESQLFTAMCAECGDQCEVPFKPTGEKPVLCDNCFRGGSNRREERAIKPMMKHNEPAADEFTALKEEMKQLQTKLDKILTLLQRTSPVKEITVMKQENAKEAENEVVEKKASKKKVEKEPVVKKAKAPAKKPVKKSKK